MKEGNVSESRTQKVPNVNTLNKCVTMRRFGYFLMVCMLHACHGDWSYDDDHILHVGVLLEMTNHWYSDIATGLVDVLQYVTEDINKNQAILPGYTLNFTVYDTQVGGYRAKQFNCGLQFSMKLK